MALDSPSDAGGTEPSAITPVPLHNEPPLCVDLDGTLVRTDLLFEMALSYVRQKPSGVLDLMAWTLRGKARLKTELAARVRLDAATLPYNPELLAELRSQKSAGRKILLVTASPMAAARGVASHVGLFDDVLATEEGVNLSGSTKRDRLVGLFGPAGFDYVGNAWADIKIWRASREAWLADPYLGVAFAARRVANVTAVFNKRPPLWRTLPRVLRVHQWIKNLLIFVPLLTSHRFVEYWLSMRAAVGFLAFSLCASAIYVFNDLLDLQHDRAHPRKRTRAMAIGNFPINQAVPLVPVLLMLSAFISSVLPWEFFRALIVYAVMSLLYSWWLKRHELLDVLVLAGLWTIRLFAGSAATGIEPSFWFLSFSMFIFMSLALAKRCSELITVRERRSGPRAHGRDYRIDDLAVLAAMGGGCGCVAVLVFALYVYNPQSRLLYRDREALLMICPLLLYWISRVWLKTWRGEMSEDPVVFAVTDRASRWIAVAAALILLYAK